jgi:hypothetical protein
MRDFSRLARVRAIWEKQARAELGQANGALQEADRAVEDATPAHQTAIAPANTSGGLDDVTMRRIAGMATHNSYTAAEVVRKQTETRVRAAHGSWRRSAQDLEVAEKLEERRRQALAYLARRSAEATLDELMALRRRKS